MIEDEMLLWLYRWAPNRMVQGVVLDHLPGREPGCLVGVYLACFAIWGEGWSLKNEAKAWR